MNNASQFQRSFLPNFDEFPNLDAFAVYQPLEVVGGDLYALERLRGDTLAFLVGDVVGHGLAAAMASVVVLSAFKRICMDCDTREYLASYLMEELNAELTPLLHKSKMYCTAFIAVFNTKSGSVSYTRAGHPYPYIYQGKSDELIQLDDAHGQAIGFNSGFYYEQKTAYLGKHDIFVCFSDGITECRDEEGNQFGNWRLERAIEAGKASPLEICESILAQAKAHCLEKFEDDTTLLAFRRK